MQQPPTRKHVRLAGYSYRTPGSYFVTVCCAQRRLLFEEGATKQVAQDCWDALPGHFPSVEIGEFVVMPNHVHGIVTLLRPAPGRARHASPLHPDPGPPSLGAVIGSFKSAVARRLRQLDSAVVAVWQRGYYEHVIRDDEELLRVVEYIQANPARWEEDEYFIRREMAGAVRP